jgi:hypothetical protein
VRSFGSSLPAVALVLITACGARSELDAPNLPDSGPPVGLPPIDPVCAAGGSASTFPPFVPLVPPDEPADCGNGFEVGDATPGSTYTLATNQAAGSAGMTLDVDFATYEKADGVIINGVYADGTSYTLLDTCRLQTWTAGDPTGGHVRPPDETIRQFRLNLEAGTMKLIVDFGGVVSPMYIQVLGLCDFMVAPFSDAVSWQTVP